MISLFIIIIILFVAPLGNNMTQQQTQFKICSSVDILMTFIDPNRVLKEYLCQSA